MHLSSGYALMKQRALVVPIDEPVDAWTGSVHRNAGVGNGLTSTISMAATLPAAERCSVFRTRILNVS